MTKGWLRLRAGVFRIEVDWVVEPGKTLVLFGPSGAGKTLTLRGIAGLARPEAGAVEVAGRAVYDSERGIDVPPHRRRIGYVPQHYALFPHLSVAGNIAFGLRGVPPPERDSTVARLMSELRLDGLADRAPRHLSGGERQRVALARALAPHPDLLLLDEPFSALDAPLRREVRAPLRETLARAGVPVLLVTHDQEEALALGDQVVVLNEGRVAARGAPRQVLGSPASPLVARLAGVENTYRAVVASHDTVNGTSYCRAGEVAWEVPLLAVQPGSEVTVGVRAQDVLLSVRKPEGLSARNVFAGRVARLDEGTGVHVRVEGDVAITARVTPHAVASLGLAPGMQVWAIVKASSCVMMSAEGGGEPPLSPRGT